MYLLDTDHISFVARGGAVGRRIIRRLESVQPDEIALSVVTYEEQVRGWLAEISATRDLDKQVGIYRELQRMLDRYCSTPVLPFDQRAASVFSNLVRQRVRIGTMDLKIAAIAVANDATLLTRNTAHFEKVPGLRFENWAD